MISQKLILNSTNYENKYKDWSCSFSNDTKCNLLLGQKYHSILEDINAKYVAALNTEDSKIIANLYSENAVIHNTDGSLVKGRDNIRAYYQNIFNTSKLSATVKIVDVQRLSRKHVFTTGMFELKLRISGAEYNILGESTNIMKKEKGKWVIDMSYRYVMPKQLETKILKIYRMTLTLVVF